MIEGSQIQIQIVTNQLIPLLFMTSLIVKFEISYSLTRELQTLKSFDHIFLYVSINTNYLKINRDSPHWPGVSPFSTYHEIYLCLTNFYCPLLNPLKPCLNISFASMLDVNVLQKLFD